MMTPRRSLALAPTLVLVAACGHGGNSSAFYFGGDASGARDAAAAPPPPVLGGGGGSLGGSIPFASTDDAGCAVPWSVDASTAHSVDGAATSTADAAIASPVDGSADSAGDGAPSPRTDGSTARDADSDAAPSDCPPSARFIYVTGESNQLFSYRPETGDFKLVGAFDCLSGPTHMTVDRKGTAWVVASSLLYRASTEDAHCSRVESWTPGVNDFADFSLSFVTTTACADPHLYVLDDSARLASFDPATGVRTIIRTLAGFADGVGDMTSDGDGHLYFVHDVTAQRLFEIRPSSGEVVDSWRTTETGGVDEALAFYGGLFYDFLDSNVYTFDPTTGAARSIGTAPLSVTGAGQSTCVPKSAPPPANIK